MHRIDSATKAVDLFGPGKHGFKDGNPLTGDPATSLNASWFNSLQEEAAGIVEAAGLSLDPSDNTQLRKAVKLLCAPSGKVDYFARSSAPAGWLVADGSAVSRTTYADLFAALGTTYGAGDGSTTFTLPDLRGVFVRGLDGGRGVDSGRTLGSDQAASAGSINVSTATLGVATGSTPVLDQISINGTTWNDDGTARSVNVTAGDTRPRNVALLVCIKT